jgi:hypothetical protein
MVHSPIVIVSLLFGGLGLDIQAVVDSGADATVVPAEVAAALGIEWDKLPPGTRGGGVGGACEMRPVTMTIKYKEWNYSGPVMVAEPKYLPVVLLGRTDFFGGFVARFNWFTTPPEFHLDPATGGKR